MRQCPNCKKDNPDDARFCSYCGMRLPELKEQILYSDLEDLEEAPKTEFSDQEIEEESEKVIDEAKKLLNPIPDNLDRMIEEVTREELEQELHRKLKLKEAYIKEQEKAEEETEEPTRMIGEDKEEETEEPTRMFTGDIGDFVKKKKEYEDVPEEDAYEEILQSWERKRKEKKIRRKREGKDTSRIPKVIREKKSWSDLTGTQKKIVKRVALGVVALVLVCIAGNYYGRPEAVANRYCKAYVQEDWKRTGHLSDLPGDGYTTLDEYVSYMKKNAVTKVTDFTICETKDNRQTKIESGGKQRALTVTYKNGTKKKSSEVIILQKQKSRKWLLFANWKVSSDEMIAKDFNLYVPSGSEVWVDGKSLTKDYRVKEDSDGLEQYKVSLFEGTHKVKARVPWFQTYQSEFQASDKGSTTVSRMKISENGKKKLDKKMKKVLRTYIDAARNDRAFSEVSGLFEKNSKYEKENKEFYNDLKKQLRTADGYTTQKVNLGNCEGKYVISGVTGVVRGNLSYDYEVTYSAASGDDSGQISKNADGSSEMSAEFVYKDGTYQLRTVNPGSIWYRESQ